METMASMLSRVTEILSDIEITENDALLNGFIETELARLRAKRPAYVRPPASIALLDELFLASLEEVWGVEM